MSAGIHQLGNGTLTLTLANKVSHKATAVTNTLLNAFQRVTGFSKQLPAPVFTKVQLWGAAVPLNITQS